MNKIETIELNDTVQYEELIYRTDLSNITLELKGNILTEFGDTISGDDITPDNILNILKFDTYEPIYGECIVIVRTRSGIRTFLCGEHGLVFIYEYID